MYVSVWHATIHPTLFLHPFQLSKLYSEFMMMSVFSFSRAQITLLYAEWIDLQCLLWKIAFGIASRCLAVIHWPIVQMIITCLQTRRAIGISSHCIFLCMLIQAHHCILWRLNSPNDLKWKKKELRHSQSKQVVKSNISPNRLCDATWIILDAKSEKRDQNKWITKPCEEFDTIEFNRQPLLPLLKVWWKIWIKYLDCIYLYVIRKCPKCTVPWNRHVFVSGRCVQNI